MPSLYPEQQAAIDRALAEPTRRFIFNFDTGCGKTPTAIQLCKQQGFERILVVCPAIVKWHWAKEFDRWGYLDHRGRVEITSYESMKKPLNTGDWQAIIFDELHYIQNASSKRSQNAFALVKSNPNAFVLGLTATLIPTYPWAVWNQLRTFWPERWGNPTKSGGANWRFCERYFEKLVSEYGVSWGKIKPEYEAELASKISQVSHRLTRDDLAKRLPPFNLQALYVPKEPDAKWFTEYVNDCSDSNHLAIFTYHHETAFWIRDCLKWMWDGSVYLITGNDPPEKRIRMLQEAQDSEDAIIICTMACIGTGIDLTWLDLGLCVEWTQSPGQMVQFIGRISRLNSPTHSTPLKFLCTPKNELKASKLVDRIQSLNKVIRGGEANEALEATFNLELSDDEFQASLDRLSATYIHLDDEDLEDDAYL